ncbi:MULTISPECIES: pilus assembly protein TadG-related protein [unclassified Vibrio]|uniref:Pilus assembly protein TadG-related protein n=1 Tax=Vibrio sp. HB236076 TaxID=3232307 RepID=A0AB39HLA7_9VIBR|nr:pilus assembly protein TadG-related protein [Vibrio sp. HB161653]MDP5253166.1 pilus assembly protein TadG-related protein [Vibrio sp. HB161653]
MTRLNRHFVRKSRKTAQQGVAGIWAALTLVPVMGFTFLAVEGTRYIQESSRLKDAAEAAALAMTIEDTGESSAELMAEKYIDAYVRDVIAHTITTRRTENDEDQSIQYDVNATTTHNSWFASNFIPSFGNTQNLVSESTARKYYSFANKNIDIVFVSDFSGSMTWEWGSNRSNNCSRRSNCKIDDLQQAITDLAGEVLCANVSRDGSTCEDDDADLVADKLQNRVGVVPFNVRTRETCTDSSFCDIGTTYAVTQLRYLTNKNALLSTTNYEQVDWDFWRQFSASTVYRCTINYYSDCFVGSTYWLQALRVIDVLGITSLYSGGSSYPDQNEYVDFETTVSDLFNNKFNSSYQTFYDVDDVELFSGFGDDDYDQFYNIELTNSLTAIDAINDMEAAGSTAVYQGIIRGLQVLNAGHPGDNATEDEALAYSEKVKMLLIVTDGEESPNNSIFVDLVDSGVCDAARVAIPGLYIGVIGVDFEPGGSLYQAYVDCASSGEGDDGADHIYVATSSEQLVEYIEELIAKGAASSGRTALY